MLILAAVTAVIASGFLFRSMQEARLATRSYFQAVAMHLAEAGVEEALYAANSSTLTTANGWSLVSGTTTTYMKSMVNTFNFDQATGSIYARIEMGTTFQPVIYAVGKISIPNQPGFVKQIRVMCSKRRLWGNGIVSKGTVTFSGNTVVDSYNSSIGVYNASSNRSDQATVGSLSTATDPIVVGSNSSIYGYVATTGADPDVGSNGRIYGATTPSGTLVDTTRVRHDFAANLPDATAPTSAAISLSAISGSMSLPRAGDSPGTDGRYVYTTSSISLAGSNALTVNGAVDLIVTGNISVTGNAYLSVGASASNSTFNLYCPGTINLAGNGVLNSTNVPASTMIWGTGTSTATQSVTIAGNGEYIGTVYAPNADVRLTGNGATSGAIVAKTATIGGNGNFHYDINLGNLSPDASYRVGAWVELTSAANSGLAFARNNSAPFTGLF